MAAQSLTDVVNIQAPQSGMITETVMYMWIALLIGIALALILKLATHRILVEKKINLKGGGVIRAGRYKEIWDKDIELKYLVPMFGRERIPGFPTKAYQKVNGMPFFGIRRHLILEFENKYSPIAIVPNKETGDYLHFPTIKHYDEYNQKLFLKKFRREGILSALHDYAPVVVIVGAIGFWAYMMFLQTNVIELSADKLEGVVDALQAIFADILGRAG